MDILLTHNTKFSSFGHLKNKQFAILFNFATIHDTYIEVRQQIQKFTPTTNPYFQAHCIYALTLAFIWTRYIAPVNVISFLPTCIYSVDFTIREILLRHLRYGSFST